MKRPDHQLSLFGSTSLRRSAGGGRGSAPAYPRRPFPTVAALLIDPVARTIRTIYLRPTLTGLRTIFGTQRVTFVDRPFYRAFGTTQYHDQVTDRATLPGARLSVQGQVLITGPEFTELSPSLAADLLKGTTFSQCDAYEAQRHHLNALNTHP